MHEHAVTATWSSPQLILAGALVVALVGYPLSVVRNRERRPWPLHRSVLWVAGVLTASAAVVGPVAGWASEDFVGHMVGHVLLGMLAPLLLVAALPVTLLLRSLAVVPARRVSCILRSRPIRFFTHPLVAGVLDVGGLWMLYATPLLHEAHTNRLLGAVVQLHVFVAGFLFTAAIVGRDPNPHRAGFALRAVVLVAAIAAHDMLAKHLYAHPPVGVAPERAELGGMVMYYAGDAVEVVLIVLLCHQWFRATAPQHPARRMRERTGIVRWASRWSDPAR